ncbi:MAG: tetratricopeptide repeat protein [Pirellulales bacterium]
MTHRERQGCRPSPWRIKIRPAAIAVGVAALHAALAAGCHSGWPRTAAQPTGHPARGTASRAINGVPLVSQASRPMAVAQDDEGVRQASAGQPVIRQQSGDDPSLFSDENLENLKPRKVFGNLRQLTPWKRDEDLGRRYLQEGDNLFREKKYDEAVGKYKSAAFRWPESVVEEDALFMLGECYFFTDRYPKASDTYAKLLKRYSSGGNHCRHLEKAVARQFAIARYWEQVQAYAPKNWAYPNLTDKTRPRFDTTTGALAAYQSVWMNDPTGPLADDAVMAAANNYFTQSRFEDADFHYTQLREQHTGSEHLVDAYVLGLQAKIKTYQGPNYDGVPLEQSGNLADQMLTQFPTELGPERQRVVETQQKIRELNAERHWSMATYYGKNKYYGGTRYYCDLIIKEYPDTRFASLAEAKLKDIAGLPDNPPQKLKWLLDMIPSRDRDEIQEP